MFNSGDGTIKAHVFAFELANPHLVRLRRKQRLVVRHSCDIKLCCNPKCLLLGTQKDNMADMDARGRRVNNPARGEDHPGAKLSRESVETARRLHALGASSRSLAKVYGVTSTVMDDVIKRRSWR